MSYRSSTEGQHATHVLESAQPPEEYDQWDYVTHFSCHWRIYVYVPQTCQFQELV